MPFSINQKLVDFYNNYGADNPEMSIQKQSWNYQNDLKLSDCLLKVQKNILMWQNKWFIMISDGCKKQKDSDEYDDF